MSDSVKLGVRRAFLKTAATGGILLISFLSCRTQLLGQGNKESPLSCRIEIEEREDHFKLKLYIENSTAEDIIIVMGRGGVARTVTPNLYFNHLHVAPANFQGAPRRSMRPVPLTIPANKEILYDSYVINYPKGRNFRAGKLQALIRFPDFSDHRLEHKLQAEADLKIPESPKH